MSLLEGVITVLAGRASPENPSTSLSDPDEWLYDALGATKSVSGVRVSESSALTFAPVFRAVDRISTDVAKVPTIVNRYLRNGGKERDRKHAAYRLLRRQPNRYMSAFTFKKALTANVLLHGNGYAYIDSGPLGDAAELLPILPQNCTPVRENGRLWYVVNAGGEYRKVESSRILHIKGLSFDGVAGVSVLSRARESLGLGLAMQEHTARFFLNSARASVVLEHPATLSPEAAEKIRRQWNELHAGLENAHKTAVLEEGMKAHEMTINARDAQLIEARRFSVREVANWFGLPPHKIGDDAKSSYNSLEQENQAYLDDVLDGWFVAWEEECNEKLLLESEKRRETHEITFVRQALVRADLTARANYYQKAVGGPWLTPDEARDLEDLNALPEGQGDKLLRPGNMVVADEEPDEPPVETPPPPPPAEPAPADEGGEDDEADRAAARTVVEDALGRMVRRLTVAGRKAGRKPQRFLEWAHGLEADHAETVRAAVLPALAVAGVPALRREAAVDRIFAGVRGALVNVYDTATPAEFDARLAAAADAVDESLAASILETLEI